ncbi:DUF551 domain-containing protein [Cronobacter sakazakii]
MSEISKERAQEIFLGNGPEPTVAEERELARIALDWLAMREILDGVPQEAIDGGWTARGLSDYAKQLETELAALRERAEPVAYADPQAFRNFMAGTATKEWMWARPDAGLVPVFVEAPPAPVVADEITADFKLVSRKKCMKCDQTVFGYTVNGLCEECYMSEQATPVLPECLERLLKHAHGLTLGTDWNAGTAAKFHRDPLIQAVKDCRAIFTRQPLSVDVLAGDLRNAPLAPSDNQGRQRAPVAAGWIACSERMPEVGDIVLTADNGGVNVGEMEHSGASYRYFTSVVSGRELPATHWMPLPEAPGKEG